MNMMFYDAKLFNRALTTWDVSRVEAVDRMDQVEQVALTDVYTQHKRNNQCCEKRMETCRTSYIQGAYHKIFYLAIGFPYTSFFC